MSESDGKASTPASGPNPHKLTMGPTVGSKAPLEVSENPRAFAVVIANSSLTGNHVLRSLAEGQTAISQFFVQLKAVVLTVVWTSVFTYLILKITSFIVPLRVDEQEEIEGLDLRSHGEKGYHSD